MPFYLEIPRWSQNQRHFIVENEDTLLELLKKKREQEYILYSITATDNRQFIDRTYKLHYILSSAQKDEIIILEYSLPNPNQKEFTSVRSIFPIAVPFEYKICDLFELKIKNIDDRECTDFLLHTIIYPPEFSPLSRRHTPNKLVELLEKYVPAISQSANYNSLTKGMFIFPVGPIHAGIIEPGNFRFHVAGEVIEKLTVKLGYKHRGIEKLFETHYTLLDGWQLAEKVSGDSSVAHSIAYCQAVEDLAQISIPEEVYLWRAILLEIERLYNHISDIGLLAIGVAYEKAASRLAILRELFAHYINYSLSKNRFLRGMNRPGGIKITDANIRWDKIRENLDVIVDEALVWGRKLLESPAVRERMIDIGILLKEKPNDATELVARDATGLVARASGWLNYDVRLRHPSPPYRNSNIRRILDQTILKEEDSPINRSQVYMHDLKGDVFARLAIRVAEIESSHKMLSYWLTDLPKSFKSLELHDIESALDNIPETAMGLGYVEGWRGAVVYTIFKGHNRTIHRCDITDPSFLNWYIFENAVVRKTIKRDDKLNNILADFPLINKSFNLSYAGHDL